MTSVHAVQVRLAKAIALQLHNTALMAYSWLANVHDLSPDGLQARCRQAS